ncbi:MAG: RluA family pseudouridine synthase [Firmicutes bacterium]|nr:RluA family pseudouridine synthase [Bacillota bacterium]
MQDITITRNDADQRLDRFLKKYLGKAPLSLVYKIVRKDVKINGKREKEDYLLREGDVLSLYLSDQDIAAYSRRDEKRHAKRQFKICYEDDEIIIVSKPFGLLVHGDKSEKKNTLANQVTDYLIETGAYEPRLEKSFVPSPVHRLDRNTTGLVIFGKTAEALRAFSAMMREAPEGPEDAENADEAEISEESVAAAPASSRSLRKFYLTIVEGRLEKELHLKGRLAKDEARNRGRVLPLSSPEGRYIETIARPLYSGKRYSLVEVELVTGRSHQIRAHLSHAGFPLLGDTKYGGRAAKNMRGEAQNGKTTQLLHARRVEFISAEAPYDYLNGTSVTAPLPPEWEQIQLELFGKVMIDR